jgi:hypothetical protein
MANERFKVSSGDVNDVQKQNAMVEAMADKDTAQTFTGVKTFGAGKIAVSAIGYNDFTTSGVTFRTLAIGNIVIVSFNGTPTASGVITANIPGVPLVYGRTPLRFYYWSGETAKRVVVADGLGVSLSISLVGATTTPIEGTIIYPTLNAS